MIYFIIKRASLFENIENSYDIVASSKDIDAINDKLKGLSIN